MPALSTLPMVYATPEIDYVAVAPILVVFAGLIVSVLIESFAPSERRHSWQVALSIGTLAVAFVVLVTASVDHLGKTFGGSVVIDGPALFLQGALLLMGLLGVLTMAEKFSGTGPDAFTPVGASTPGSDYEKAAAQAGLATSEVFPLALTSIAGMMIFASSGDLIALFVALEILSLPLYILTGIARRRRLLSQEASLKYFILGAFSSAFLLFGAALLYGYSGTVEFAGIAAAISGGSVALDSLLLPGIAMVLIGLLFKVGAVPFHSWTPDAYQGAPTPVTGFMAACTKAAAFGAILRFGYVAVEGDRWDWRVIVIAVAALTMIVGAVMSVTQTDIKRLLAYSSIAHAGFILVGVLAFDVSAVTGVLFYLVAYGFATIAAFAVVSMVRRADEGSEATHVSQWAGLGRKHPIVAATFGFLLLAFAGIPLTSGFTAKFAVFAPAVTYGSTSGIVLVVLGVLASAVTAYVYVRLIVLMYFTESSSDSDGVVAFVPSSLTTVAVAVGTIVTLILGVVPGPVLELAARASEFIR